MISALFIFIIWICLWDEIKACRGFLPAHGQVGALVNVRNLATRPAPCHVKPATLNQSTDSGAKHLSAIQINRRKGNFFEID